MYRQAAIAVLLVLLGFGGAWKVQNWRYTSKIATINAEHAKVRADLADKARQIEATYRTKETALREAADKQQEQHREQVRAIDVRLASALDRLRQRPERRIAPAPAEVPSTPETCAGVSGAELARGDGAFLIGYGADVAKLREALRTCETRYEQVRTELSKE